MRAALFKAPHEITVGDRPDAAILEPTDAVVRVVLACVCGSDLWYYRGESPFEPGPIGHEFIGVVEDIGAEVARHRARATSSSRRSPSATAPARTAGTASRRACVDGGFFGDERRRRPGRGGARPARRRHARARPGLAATPTR